MQAWPLPQLCAGQISFPRLPSERLVSPRLQPLHQTLCMKRWQMVRQKENTLLVVLKSAKEEKLLIKVNSAAKS